MREDDQFCALSALICLSNLSIILYFLLVSRIRYVQSRDSENEAPSNIEKQQSVQKKPVFWINCLISTLPSSD
jgi:hypothetical protein